MTSARRSIRFRLTAFYGSLFLISGAALLGIAYGLVRSQLHTATFYATIGGAKVTGQVSSGGGVTGTARAQLTVPTNGAVPNPPPLGVELFQRLSSAAAQQRHDTLHTLLVESLIALAIMAIASMLLGWFMAGRALEPVRAMTSAARDVSEHNLHSRLPADGPHDELSDLANTFNALLARLEGAFDSQRRFVANASHELRTPLTLERAVIEVALADPNADANSLRATCERVLAIGAEQEALIEALLTLARSQRGLDRREPLDLADVTRAIISEQGVVIRADLEPAPTEGEPRLVGRMIANLIDNAVRHNEPNGWVHVRTLAGETSSTFEVVNGGPVVPPDEVDRLLQPFQRLGTDRTGSSLGLGLSIVAAIAAAHRAELSVTARPEGGLAVRVTFPGVLAATELAPPPPLLPQISLAGGAPPASG